VRVAFAMAGKSEGAEALLQTIASGKASARLLQISAITDRLAAAKVGNLDERIATLTKGLAPLTQEVQTMIDARQKAYKPADASAERGQKIFAINCAACHSIDKQGGNVGPNLDGIGARGLDRLIEDILDPNRNVDPAFFYSVVDLKDGTNIVGMQRAEEGEVLVFVDATAKEIRFP